MIDALDEACLADYDGEIILIVGAIGVGKGLLARERFSSMEERRER